jgi:hypothetical protein
MNAESFLNSVRGIFEYYKSLGQKTMDQVTDDELFQEVVDGINSLAILVHHLSGNMKSRWTDFLTSDGEKSWRLRDAEFEDVLQTRKEVMKAWEEGWRCLFGALDSVNEDNFSQKVYIRNQAHSIPDAIHRQLGHYAYHVGQMVYLGKIFKGDEWESLSIPKGGSKAFNEKKLAQGKHGGHFTDDLK